MHADMTGNHAHRKKQDFLIKWLTQHMAFKSGGELSIQGAKDAVNMARSGVCVCACVCV